MSDEPSQRQDSTDSQLDAADRRSYLRGVAAASVFGAGFVGATASAAAGDGEKKKKNDRDGRPDARVSLEFVCYDADDDRALFRVHNDSQERVKVVWKDLDDDNGDDGDDDGDGDWGKLKLRPQGIEEFWVDGDGAVGLYRKWEKIDVAYVDTDVECEERTVTENVEIRGVCYEPSKRHRGYPGRALFHVKNYNDEDLKVDWEVEGGTRSGTLHLYANRTRKLWVPLDDSYDATVALYADGEKIAIADAYTKTTCEDHDWANGKNGH